MNLNIKPDIKSIIIFLLVVFIAISYFNLTSKDTESYYAPQIFYESQNQDSETTIIESTTETIEEQPEDSPTPAVPPAVPPAEESTETVSESTEQTESEKLFAIWENLYNNNPHIIRNAGWSYDDFTTDTLSPNEFAALIIISESEINLSSGILNLKVWQDFKATGAEPLKLTNGELKLFRNTISSVDDWNTMYSNCNERLNKNCYGQYFPQTSIDLSNNCISGCDNILTRSTYYSSWNDLVDNDILIDVSDKLEIFGFFKLSDNSRWNISSYTTTHATLQDLPYCGQTPPGTGNCPTGQTITLPWNDINNTFRACSALKLTGPNSGEEKYLGTNSGIIAFITAPYNGVEWSSFETVPNRFSYKKITDDARISHSSTTSPDVYLVDSGCPMDPKTYYMATKSINFGYYKTLI